jgi:2-polyprenyl-3-methyl-5-hydroxy-6-metoxy-1,4-benzoquinol methylase
MRHLETEHADTEQRRYAYDFDYRMHGYMLRAFAPMPAGHALELGCHHGEFTKRLLLAFESVTVVEGAADSIDIARANVGDIVTFVHARFEEFAPTRRYDAIFLIHTLEHLDDPQRILAAIRSWLAPGGQLYVAVPNAYAASRQIAVEMGLVTSPTAVTDGEYAHGHRRTYDLAALRAEIQAAGLTETKSGGVFFKPFANYQFDQLIASGIVTDEYLEGCYALGARYPDLCASIYVICGRV